MTTEEALEQYGANPTDLRQACVAKGTLEESVWLNAFATSFATDLYQALSAGVMQTRASIVTRRERAGLVANEAVLALRDFVVGRIGQ